jgi:RNA polymerase sigma-70 factor (ECF subfamily)
MRPLKILLRLKRPRLRVKAFVNIRDRDKPHPRQLHLGYFDVTQDLNTVKDRIFSTLVEKWPRKRKPQKIDWNDAELKLSKLRVLFNERGAQPCEREPPDASAALVTLVTTLAEAVETAIPTHSQPHVSDADADADADGSSSELSAPLGASISPDADVQVQLALQTPLPRWQDELAMHMPELKRFAMALTGNAANADDLVQSTLMRAIEAADSFAERSSLRTWLYSIMRHLAIDYSRQARVRDLRSLEDIDEVVDIELEDRRASEEEWKELSKELSAERFQDLESAIGSDYWIVVYLRYFQEYTLEEVAKNLTIPVNTVSSRLARARSRIRQALLSRVNR